MSNGHCWKAADANRGPDIRTTTCVDDLEAVCRTEVQPGEMLEIDLGGIELLDIDAADALAWLLFQFTTGSLWDAGQPRRYVTVRHATVGGVRRQLDEALRRLKRRPGVLVVAPTEGSTPASELLFANCLGATASVRRARLTFSILWTTASPLLPREVQHRLDADFPGEAKQVYSDLSLLTAHGLILRDEDGRYSAVK